MYSTPATPAPSEHSADSSSPSSLMSSPVFTDNDDVQMIEEAVSVVGSQSPTSPYQQHVWVRPAKLHPQSLYPQNQHNQFAGARIPTPIHPNFFPGMLSPAYSQPSPWEHSAAISSSVSHNYPPNHPMPSPITEDIMDDSPAYLAGTQLSRLTMNGEDGMDVDVPMTPSRLMDPPGLPPRTGRARSGAITEKKRIFMGYLEDCEKCRSRTPGHLTHFLPV